MLRWFSQLDQILRGDATRVSALRDGHIHIPVTGLTVVVTLLAIVYGLCMGSFAILRAMAPDVDVGRDALMQLLASAVKLPLLFFLTLVVTFPSLYVFNALVGSRLSLVSVARLLVAMLAVTLAVLASFGPIVVFFALSTTSYPFMKLLNVVAAAIAGILGLAFLLRTLHRLVLVQDRIDFPRRAPERSEAQEEAPAADDAESAGEEQRSALDWIESATGRKATAVFQIWTVAFAIVGAQMSWVLRPFIGDPDLPFSWFRRRESNFFLDVLRAIGELFGT